MKKRGFQDSTCGMTDFSGAWADYCRMLETDLPHIEPEMTEDAIKVVYDSLRRLKKNRFTADSPKIFWCHSDDELRICMSWFKDRNRFLRSGSKNHDDKYDVCPWPRLARFARSFSANSINNGNDPLGSCIAGELPEADRFTVWLPGIHELYQSLDHAAFDAQSLLDEEVRRSWHASSLENAARLDWLLKAKKINELPGFNLELLQALGVIYRNCLLWLPFENASILLERPLIVKHMQGVMHADGAPAIVWRNGTSVWALNGIRVPREIAEIPAGELKADIILGTADVDVRREIVRKIGVEKLLSELGAELLDHDGEYQLYALDIGDGWKRPYLKMKNPSLGVYHVEGVHPVCRTVPEALAWRNGTDEIPAVIS